MKRWPLQNAKNQFSEMVRRAETEGPQNRSDYFSIDHRLRVTHGCIT